MSTWRNLQRTVDRIVDTHFAEPCEIHPWVVTSRYSSLGGPDHSRPILKTTAIFAQPGAAVSGEGGTQGGGMSTRVVMQDVWTSITLDKLGRDVNMYRTGDRIYFPEREEWHEIVWVDLSATDRPNIHMVRIMDANAP